MCQLAWHRLHYPWLVHVLVAPGAAGSAASMQAHVDGLHARGVSATAVGLPLRRAELAVPVYRALALARPQPATELVVGGQSYGGRVASLLAAERPTACAGLICFSYPLHRPGVPDWDERSRHWPLIEVPVLLVSGGSDPFARVDLLRQAVETRLPHARLVSIPGLGHRLAPALDEVLDAAAAFVSELEAGGRPA